MARVECTATAKTTGVIKLSYTVLDIDDIEKHNINTLTTHLGMNYEISKRMDLNILAGRAPAVSEFTSGSNVYINNFGNIDISRQVWKDLKFSIFGRFDKNEFHNSERKDHIYNFGVSSVYSVNKFMNVDFKYSNMDRHSNFELQSDRINRASIGVNFAF